MVVPALPPDEHLTELSAEAIVDAFEAYRADFRACTLRAQEIFETRDWPATRRNAAERLALYRPSVSAVEARLRDLLGERIGNKALWGPIKAAYSRLIADRDDRELAETYLNSVTRRVFSTVGVDPQIEFVETDFDMPPSGTDRPVYRTFPAGGPVGELIGAILEHFRLRAPYRSPQQDARAAAGRVEAELAGLDRGPIERAEMADTVFYRGKRAFLVGRLVTAGGATPLVLALAHAPDGILIDAVLAEEDAASIVFSFARSPFLVLCDRPHEVVQFLNALLPRKLTGELYAAIGQHKHGKTELYRDLLAYLADSDDPFELAHGAEGLVMVVLTLPGYDVVFKIIRDTFGVPKQTSREAVRQRYDLVYQHDRAGRLVEAYEFEHLQFDRARFGPELLAHLEERTARSVEIDGERIVIHHCYIERRVRPLDVYLKECAEAEAHAAVVDFGYAIKDLAAANVFPGDLLPKNFGVTRHGRVVFYDYDELAHLHECRFRKIPEPTCPEEELSAQPWYRVGPDDIFPEEFRAFVRFPRELQRTFEQYHSDIYTAEFWQEMQSRLNAGEIIDILPYRPDQRLF